MDTMASQITSLTIVYSTVCSGADQRKHQSPASLAFVWGIHRWPVNSPHKWPVTLKMFPFDDVIMFMFRESTSHEICIRLPLDMFSCGLVFYLISNLQCFPTVTGDGFPSVATMGYRMNIFIETGWRHMASRNLVNKRSRNGLASARCRAITRTNGH